MGSVHDYRPTMKCDQEAGFQVKGTNMKIASCIGPGAEESNQRRAEIEAWDTTGGRLNGNGRIDRCHGVLCRQIALQAGYEVTEAYHAAPCTTEAPCEDEAVEPAQAGQREMYLLFGVDVAAAGPVQHAAVVAQVLPPLQARLVEVPQPTLGSLPWRYTCAP